MIRTVKLADAAEIVAIYNHYIINTTITFETDPLTAQQMSARIELLSSHYPYFVYEEDGKVVGYCYAHGWKEKAAYNQTVETTIYLSPTATRKGIGKKMLVHLIQECKRRNYHSLIACITQGNEASFVLHSHLGFQQASLFKEVGRKFNQWLDVVDYQLILK